MISVPRIVMFLPVLFSIGCATVITNPVEIANYQKLQTAIDQNDSIAAKDILKEKSFVTKQSFLSHNSAQETIIEEEVYTLFGAVVGYETNSIYPGVELCKPGVVQAFLDAHLPVRAIDLSAAITSSCFEILERILKVMPEKEILSGLKQFKEKFDKTFYFKNTGLNPDSFLQKLSLISSSLSKKCETEVVCPGYSEMVSGIASMKQSIGKLEEEIARIKVEAAKPKEVCEPLAAYGYFPTQRLDSSHYVLTSELEMRAWNGRYFNKMAILKTKRGLAQGYRLAISAEYIGAKMMKLTNGFDEMVDVWKECAGSTF